MANELQYGMSGDRPYGLYYQHSGRVPIPGVVMAGAAEPQEAAALTAAPPAPQPPPLNNTPTAPDAAV